MKKVAIVLLSVLLFSSVTFGEETERASDRRDPTAPTYESPVLSLLFLPVNLLIKMASVFGPSESSSSQGGRSASSGSEK